MNRVFTSIPKLFAVIGDPIAHSRSPAIHQEAIDALGLNALYVACQVRPRELSQFVKTVRAKKSISGFNVTLPHKEKIGRYLDCLTKTASEIGAVNAVYWKQGKLWGDNTDAAGFALALQSLKRPTDGKMACVFGAGGASCAILYALGHLGFSRIVVVNRTVSKARALVRKMELLFPKIEFEVVPFQDLDGFFAQADFFINTTSIGLKGEDFPDLPFDRAKKRAVACDIIYFPAVTPFLKIAALQGLKIQNGAAMFLNQAAISFEIFNGQSPKERSFSERAFKGLY